jgi:hypothetical protein
VHVGRSRATSIHSPPPGGSPLTLRGLTVHVGRSRATSIHSPPPGGGVGGHAHLLFPSCTWGSRLWEAVRDRRSPSFRRSEPVQLGAKLSFASTRICVPQPRDGRFSNAFGEHVPPFAARENVIAVVTPLSLNTRGASVRSLPRVSLTPAFRPVSAAIARGNCLNSFSSKSVRVHSALKRGVNESGRAARARPRPVLRVAGADRPTHFG